MVIIMDDEDREKRGRSDPGIREDHARGDQLHGQVRSGPDLPDIDHERCRQLRLPLMVNSDNQLESTTSPYRSRRRRCHHHRYLRGGSCDDGAGGGQAGCATAGPGAAGPHLSVDGAAGRRAGAGRHTEAGCDLARLAGFFTQFGDRRDPQRRQRWRAAPIWRISRPHTTSKIGTIADLIQYRIKNEKTVERVTQNPPTRRGDSQLVAYQDVIGNEMHLALVKGEISPTGRPWCATRAEHTGDLFESARDCGWPLRRVMDQVSSEGGGVIVESCATTTLHAISSIVSRITSGTASMMRFPERRNRKRDDGYAPSVSGRRSCPISACARCA